MHLGKYRYHHFMKIHMSPSMCNRSSYITPSNTTSHLHSHRPLRRHTLPLKPISILPTPKTVHKTRFGRTNPLSNQVLKLRPIRSRRILLLTQELRSIRQRIIPPTPVKVQPIHRVGAIVGGEGVCGIVEAVCVGVFDGIPENALVCLIDEEAVGEV